MAVILIATDQAIQQVEFRRNSGANGINYSPRSLPGFETVILSWTVCGTMGVHGFDGRFPAESMTGTVDATMIGCQQGMLVPSCGQRAPNSILAPTDNKG